MAATDCELASFFLISTSESLKTSHLQDDLLKMRGRDQKMMPVMMLQSCWNKPDDHHYIRM